MNGTKKVGTVTKMVGIVTTMDGTVTRMVGTVTTMEGTMTKMLDTVTTKMRAREMEIYRDSAMARDT